MYYHIQLFKYFLSYQGIFIVSWHWLTSCFTWKLYLHFISYPPDPPSPAFLGPKLPSTKLPSSVPRCNLQYLRLPSRVLLSPVVISYPDSILNIWDPSEGGLLASYVCCNPITPSNLSAPYKCPMCSFIHCPFYMELTPLPKQLTPPANPTYLSGSNMVSLLF